MKLTPQMKMILKQLLPPSLSTPLFCGKGAPHPIAELSGKVKTRDESKAILSMSIEQVKFTGTRQVWETVIEALNKIDTWDGDTKAAVLIIAVFLLGKEGKA